MPAWRRYRGPWVACVGLLVGAAVLAACRSARRPAMPASGPAAPSAVSTASLTPEQRVAVGWIRRARAAEVGVTPQLLELAELRGARMVGLEHRIKSLASTVSKLERLQARAPATPLEDVDVYDALRYTMVVPDEPAGHHDATVRETLAALEDAGHAVRKVKNYWQRGDSYSGTNCTLETAEGMPWELQFHTPGSFETKSSVHDDYERMRDAATPIEERRRLFLEMTEVWESVPVPAGILVPGSLHEREVLRLLPAP